MSNVAIDRFEYKGYGIHDSVCKLEIYRLAEGKPIVVMTELDENPGTSVTNACEDIASAVYQQYIEPHGITPDKVRFIEHYPTSVVEFSEIGFQVRTDFRGEVKFYHPKWSHVKNPDWLETQITK